MIGTFKKMSIIRPQNSCFSFETFERIVNWQKDGYTGNSNLKMTAYIDIIARRVRTNII